MKKTILRFVFVLLVMLAVLPFMVFAADAADVYVGGEKISDGVVTGENITGKVTYDASHGVLTLENATISGKTDSCFGAAIYAEGDIQIVLNGSNVINGATVKGDAGAAIWSDGGIIIYGGGSLTVNGVEQSAYKGILALSGNVIVNYVTLRIQSVGSDGLYAESGDVEISEAILEIKADTGEGVHTEVGALTIKNSDIKITAGFSGLWAERYDITIDNSLIEVYGGKTGNGYGINAEDGQVWISNDSTVNANGPSGNIRGGNGIEFEKITEGNFLAGILSTVTTKTYDITAVAGINGTISPSGVTTLKENGRMTYRITPNEGYSIANVYVDGKSIGAVYEYNFTYVNENHTIQAVFKKNVFKNPYKDVKASDPFYEDIMYVTEKGLMNGIESDEFRSNTVMERAMIVTILWRMEGCPKNGENINEFTDLDEGAWYVDAVKWAESKGLVNGYGDGTFGPLDPITREQLAAILYRYVQYKGGGFVGMWAFPLRYSDVSDISEYAYEPLCWLTMKDIYYLKDGKLLDPKTKATRGEMAYMLHRLCVYFENER